MDTLGVWAMQRQTGTFTEMDDAAKEALEETLFGKAFEFVTGESYCIGDVQFSDEGPW